MARLPMVLGFDINNTKQIEKISLVHDIRKTIQNELEFSSYHSPIIIVDVRETLMQESWQDVCGTFVTYRIAPLDVNHPKIVKLADRFEIALENMFHREHSLRNVVRIVDENDKTKISLYFTHSVNSIGD